MTENPASPAAATRPDSIPHRLPQPGVAGAPLPQARSPEPGGSRPWLLALHSSGETLGVALQRLGGGDDPRLAAFPLGRGLSGALFECVEAVLPAAEWSGLGRLAVATGPGGFTGTRLTVALARTLAQQLDLPLDGVGSFRLIAQRLFRQGAAGPGPFWVVQELPRRGLVAGLYASAATAEGLNHSWDPRSLLRPAAAPGSAEALAAAPASGHAEASNAAPPSPAISWAEPLELSAPRLYREPTALAEAEAALLAGSEPTPPLRCPADVRQPDDVAELLRWSQAAAAAGRPAPWSPVLPLYPTSPVDGAP